MVDARTFQALSDPTRLKILSLLGGGSMNVSQLVQRLDCTQPAVSRHLKVLKQAGLIADVRRGKWVEYSSNPRRVEEAAEYLRALYDEGKAVHSTSPEFAGRRRTVKPRSPAKARIKGPVRTEEISRAREPAGSQKPARPQARLRERSRAAQQSPAPPGPARWDEEEGSRYVVEREEDFVDDIMS